MKVLPTSTFSKHLRECSAQKENHALEAQLVGLKNISGQAFIIYIASLNRRNYKNEKMKHSLRSFEDRYQSRM